MDCESSFVSVYRVNLLRLFEVNVPDTCVCVCVCERDKVCDSVKPEWEVKGLYSQLCSCFPVVCWCQSFILSASLPGLGFLFPFWPEGVRRRRRRRGCTDWTQRKENQSERVKEKEEEGVRIRKSTRCGCREGKRWPAIGLSVRERERQSRRCQGGQLPAP